MQTGNSSSAEVGATLQYPMALTDTSQSKSDLSAESLITSRLGGYAGLFFALKAKHPPTAAHCLRVALICSKWAAWRSMPDEQRSLLEIGALLHDVGKIGIPDHILQKPERLNDQEQLVMQMNVAVASDLLRGAGGSQELLDMVRSARQSFLNPSQQNLGARMLAISDAFDSMTAQQVFRRAMSRERAIEELCSRPNSRFDPLLVNEFVELMSDSRPELESEVSRRWLQELVSQITPGFGTPNSCGAIQAMVDSLFHYRLLDALNDAAIYLDTAGQILHWNRAATRFSGHQAESIVHRMWSVEVMRLMHETGRSLTAEECPFHSVLAAKAQINGRFSIRQENQPCLTVQLTGLPVYSGEHEMSGVILIIRDASTQVNLEQRVEKLHAIATKDPLTQVANRAELTHKLPEFLASHLQSGKRGAMIICDIDYFKRINDHHGHQAGDEALVTFADILTASARIDDLVARFGGEEFVILCDGCDIPNATAKAEEIRRTVEKTPIPSLKGNAMTASFGVTEIQNGDTEDTLLARADRALLTAKEHGRNRVEQLGSGKLDQPNRPRTAPVVVKHEKPDWISWLRGKPEQLLYRVYLAAVPKNVAIQKLSGFIADHQADVLASSDERVTIKLESNSVTQARRAGERPAVLSLEINIQTVQIRAPGRHTSYQNRERYSISVRPIKARDRRSSDLLGQAERVLQSFQAYLVAEEVDDELSKAIIEPR